jgi:Kef-type K+ transport system membrane component KefB
MDQTDPGDRIGAQPPAQPGLPLFLKMIAPSRRGRILLGVAALLDVAGIVVLTIAAYVLRLHPIPLWLSGIATALIAVGTGIFSCLVLAEIRRQNKRRLPPG